MTRFRFIPRRLVPRTDRGRNLLAAGVLSTAVGLLYFDFRPAPAEAESDLRIVSMSSSGFVLPKPVIMASTNGTSDTADGLIVHQRLEGTPISDLDRSIQLLADGLKRLESTPDYSARFFKQEFIDGELSEEQAIAMKVRHQPFSVYMKWHVGDKGREVIYVDGENDGKMLVHAGGWKARLLPCLRLDPTGSLAMAESRHPVTKAGLLQLTRELLHYRRLDLQRGGGVMHQVLDGHEFDGRPCWMIVTEYEDPSMAGEYRKSMVLVDKEWSIPIAIRNFGWGPEGTTATGEQLDAQTLIESYAYTEIEFHRNLTAMDFDRANDRYAFKR